MIALWRSPERMCAAPALTNGIVNIACFGETGCIATRRDAKGAIRPLVGNADMRRTKAGTLALRASGLMCDVFPPQVKNQFEDAANIIDTGFPCQLDAERGTLAIIGAPPGLTLVGAYALSRTGLGNLFAQSGRDAAIITVPHALLGDRLAGTACDAAAAQAELEERGLNSLIIRAFHSRVAASSQF